MSQIFHIIHTSLSQHLSSKTKKHLITFPRSFFLSFQILCLFSSIASHYFCLCIFYIIIHMRMTHLSRQNVKALLVSFLAFFITSHLVIHVLLIHHYEWLILRENRNKKLMSFEKMEKMKRKIVFGCQLLADGS